MAKLSPYYFIVLLLSIVVQNNTEDIFKHKNYDSSNYLDSEITKSCPKNGTMFIKGNRVKLSDFVRTNGDIYNLCSHIIELKHINVFAFNSLIIDMDVDVSGSQLTLFFIAPTWVVVGNRKIAVDGSKGDYIPKAEDGNHTNIDGQDGKPGLPGGPGGNFFGIGDSFVNGKSLTITANGGIGGTGQYGGNGYNQEKARYVDTKVLGKLWCGLYYDMCSGKDKQYQLNLQDNYGNFSNFHCQGLYEEENMERCSYKIFGWEGKEGGKGGNGGRGGKGGLPGTINLLDLNSSSQISTYNILGTFGHGGTGGIGGKRGENGHNVIYEDVSFLAPPKIKFEVGQEYNYRLGPNGTDGYNSVNYREDLIQANILEQYEILTTLNEYKSWLRQNSEHIKNDFVPFYKHIDENSYVRNMSSTSEFLSEVDSIDEEFYKLKSTVDFLPFYESLLGRTYFYVEKYRNDTKRVEDRTILSLLYTEILGKIFNVNEHSETYLVIEIPRYLESVKETLLMVSNLINKNNTYNVIVEKLNELSEYKENYELQIDKLITKSRQYVDGKLTVETETIMENEVEKMSKLVRDIIRFKERPINNEQELLRWGKHLQDSMITRSNFYFIRLINKLFSLLSDFAEIISSVVVHGADVPTVLRLGKKTTVKPQFSPETSKTLYNRIEAIKTKEVTEISDLLQIVLNKTRTNQDILFDVTEGVLLVYKKLQSKHRFLTVNALRSDLLKVVKIKLDELVSIIHPTGNIRFKAYQHIVNSRSAFAEFTRISQITKLSRGFVEVYNEHKHNDTQLDIIIEYIDKVYSILNVEKKREDSIYVFVYQILQRIEDVILSAFENPDKVSTLACEISKWNIPLILNSIRRKSKPFPDSYQAKDYPVHIIDYLGGASSALTAVFEQIQNYLQQKQLESHIADSSYAISKGIKFSDKVFEEKYERIKKGLGSNLVLQHYKKATGTFKQFVFPIADLYFKDIILPSHLNIYDGIADIVSMAITQIDLMLNKVEDYKKSMLDGDGIVGRKDFGGRKFRSENPFFVWKNDQYKDVIANLMSGNEVTVTAEINNSDLKDYAIKFNRIDFYFTSHNETVQESVNSIMEYFEITVSHLGNSHYRYGDDIYLITSDPLNIIYLYENDENGRSLHSGGAYEFLENVDITLSPFASWKIKLDLQYDDSSFDDLMVFKDYVDLEMGGNGFYISHEKENTLDLKVKKYYKPLDKYDKLYS